MRQPSSIRGLRASCGAAACAVAAGLALGPVAAFAEEAPNLLDDSFYAALGTFILNSDTEVRFDGESGRGDVVDWERTFGDDDMTRFRFDGYWRFGDSQRHKIRALWFNASRDDSRTFERDIEWNDVVYPANLRVDSELAFDIYELAYEYAFLRKDTYEVTGTFGVHYTELSMSLAAEGAIVGGEPVSGKVKKEGSFGAPLPVIGVRGLWDISHDFWIDASAQYFSANIDEYDGSIQDYRVAVVWQPIKWAGVGLGYNQFKVDLDVDKDSFNGNVTWTYSGPMIFYSASF